MIAFHARFSLLDKICTNVVIEMPNSSILLFNRSILFEIMLKISFLDFLLTAMLSSHEWKMHECYMGISGTADLEKCNLNQQKCIIYWPIACIFLFMDYELWIMVPLGNSYGNYFCNECHVTCNCPFNAYGKGKNLIDVMSLKFV